MSPLRRLFAVALLAIAASPAASPALAADPVFPPGARVGMVPLVGLVRARTFIGFETEDKGVKVVVADLPADAYSEVANAFKANPGGTGAACAKMTTGDAYAVRAQRMASRRRMRVRLENYCFGSSNT